MEVKKRKALLLKMDGKVYSDFKDLCKREGFSVTVSLNQIMKRAVIDNKLW